MLNLEYNQNYTKEWNQNTSKAQFKECKGFQISVTTFRNLNIFRKNRRQMDGQHLVKLYIKKINTRG